MLPHFRFYYSIEKIKIQAFSSPSFFSLLLFFVFRKRFVHRLSITLSTMFIAFVDNFRLLYFYSFLYNFYAPSFSCPLRVFHLYTFFPQTCPPKRKKLSTNFLQKNSLWASFFSPKRADFPKKPKVIHNSTVPITIINNTFYYLKLTLGQGPLPAAPKNEKKNDAWKNAAQEFFLPKKGRKRERGAKLKKFIFRISIRKRFLLAKNGRIW